MPHLLGWNTSKKKTHIGSGSLFCGSLDEDILSSLENQYKQPLGTDTVLCGHLTLNYLSVILQD